MGVLKRRTRLISFRLSDEEYQELLRITAEQGARSISDFSRTALCQALKGDCNSPSQETDATHPSHILELIKSMQELGGVITKLSGQLEKKSSVIIKS